MPRTIRFHLDENCAHRIAAGLRRRGIDVTTTPEAGLNGATDDEQLAHCLTNSRFEQVSRHVVKDGWHEIIALGQPLELCGIRTTVFGSIAPSYLDRRVSRLACLSRASIWRFGPTPARRRHIAFASGQAR